MNYEGFEVVEGSKIAKVDELITDIGVYKMEQIYNADLSFEDYCQMEGVKDKTQDGFEEECRWREERRESFSEQEEGLKEELKTAMKEVPFDTLNSFLVARRKAFEKDVIKYYEKKDFLSRNEAQSQVSATIAAKNIAQRLEKSRQK